MPTPIMQVDSFTSTAFAGNPAGVCVLERSRDAAWMQLVAREMNVAETAFLRARTDDEFDLRWFTPTVEVDLCGHATLASAHVLWESQRLAAATLRFHTRSGVLTATRRDDWIELDFPATPDEPVSAPPGLLEALGVTARYVGRSCFDFLVEVDDESTVAAVRPDFRRLATIDARGAIVTSRASAPGVDFVSRYFAPAFGIDEDPATGSTHCCLGPFWAARTGKRAFVAHQLSARRGELHVALDGDRVRLSGRAVTVLRGELLA
ncbi:MAG TPA: PhzF family phenazine biosynthesis protein [Vicinamibacterales bacterium]|nr:PhzF family phenazine biosynthesis protein [Vicinamibacterales bacterium]